MVVEGFHGNRGLVPLSPCVRLSIFSLPSPRRTSVVRVEGEQESWKSVHARCAGLDISKKDAKVCVRVAGAGRRKTVETVTTWGSMTNQILALRDHLVAEQVTLCGDGGDRGLLEAVLLPARGRRVRGDAGQRPAREEPPGPQERRLRCDLAGPARCPRPGPRLVRAARADPAVAGPDPGPDRDHPRTGPGGPAAGEAARGRRDQAVRGRLRHPRCLRPADARGADRRGPRSRRVGRPGQASAAVEDPGPDRGVDRAVQRAPRLPGPGAPGPDRPAHRRDRDPDRPDRGDDRALSGVPRPDLHHPRDQHPDRRRGRSPRPART